MTEPLNYNELARELNTAIEHAYPDWGRLNLWQSEGSYDGVSHAHRLLSAILHVIGADHVEWVVADVDTGDRSEPSITYTLTIWTQSWVVRVTRRAGERWPVVAPIPRTQLEGFELAQAPVVTIDIYGSPEREWRALLRYSVFDIEVYDRRAEWLPAALPSLLQDLKA